MAETVKGRQKANKRVAVRKDRGKARAMGEKQKVIHPREQKPCYWDQKKLVQMVRPWGSSRLQPASPAFPMMAPITESADGSQRYALTDCREELQKSEDKHKSVNDKLKLIKQTEAPQSSRQQEYDRLFNGTNARSSKECDETPMATVSTLAPAKKVTRRSLVGRVRPTPVTTGARSSSDADPHGTVTGEEAAAQTANAAAWSEAEDDQHEPPSPASVSSSIRRDIYFGDAQPSSSRLQDEGDQRTQVFPRPDAGYQHGYEGMPTYAYFQRQIEFAQVTAQMGGDINEAQRQIIAASAAANDFKMWLSALIAQQSLEQSEQLRRSKREHELQMQQDLDQQFEEFWSTTGVKDGLCDNNER